MFDEFKIGYSPDQIERHDIIECTAYTYSHFSLVAARSQKMEMYEVGSCVHGHHVFQGLEPHDRQMCTAPSMILGLAS